MNRTPALLTTGVRPPKARISYAGKGYSLRKPANAGAQRRSTKTAADVLRVTYVKIALIFATFPSVRCSNLLGRPLLAICCFARSNALFSHS